MLHIPIVEVDDMYYTATLAHQGQLIFRLDTVFSAETSSTSPDIFDSVSGLVHMPYVQVGEEHYSVKLRYQGNLTFKVESAILVETDLSVTFTETPSRSTVLPYYNFEFSAPDGHTYECKLNEKKYEACEPKKIFFGLEKGDHQLAVRAISATGGTGAEKYVYWTIDDVFNTSGPDLIPTIIQPQNVSEAGWRGIFRINCDFAHSSYNDPVVFPGLQNAAHLHQFYGNVLVNHLTTVESLVSTGDSSCQGNQLNRTSYWIPALLAPKYDATGQRELDAQGQPAWKAVPAVVGNDDEAHEIFYYSAGIDDVAAIQPIPVGLKMIAGDHSAHPGRPQETSIVRWHCQSWQSNDSDNPNFVNYIPECDAPDRVRLDIFFPSCWNGVDLDSHDHKSHMAYPISSGGPNGTYCPATHPVPIVRPSYHYAFGVKPDVYDPQTRSSRGWRLASDNYIIEHDAKGGMSLHGDWINAWHPDVMRALLENCIKQKKDCHDGNLANGFRLSGTRAGTQIQAEIINGGLGYAHEQHSHP